MQEVSPKNKVNELTAREWMPFTKTWFIHNPAKRKKNELLHPAKYPEALIKEFVAFFTKKDDVVLDPFLGTGSTLVACREIGRNGIGIELQKKYAEIAEKRVKDTEGQLQLQEKGLGCKQIVIQGNSHKIDDFWEKYSLPDLDFVITSPPYGPMLRKKGLISRYREEKGLDVQYSNDKDDLGNAQSYEEFLQKLVDILVKIKPRLKKDKYLVVILQNYMDKGNYVPLAWDFAKAMMKHYQFRGERIWCQDNKTLYPYGYRYSFVPNVHHHYCLIFKKVEP